MIVYIIRATRPQRSRFRNPPMEDVSSTETLGDAFNREYALRDVAQDVADELARTASEYGLDGIEYVVSEAENDYSMVTC